MTYRGRMLALALAGLLLVSFVSPFSYVPNPPGLHHLLAGGYRYDPRSPFVNRFATLRTPDPTPTLAAQLDRLLGQTGLDPLDPDRPLVGYRVREIASGPAAWADAAYAEATVEFRYAGGGARVYRIPVSQYGVRYDGSGTTGWRYTGLDRLFGAHQALPHLPPADAAAPQLGPPRLAAALPGLDLATIGGWTMDGFGPQHTLRWAPDGRRALLHLRRSGDGGALWLVPLDGTPARAVAYSSRDAAWSADGRLVFLRCTSPCPGGGPADLVIADPVTGDERTLGRVPGGTLAVAGAAAYVLDGEALWRVPLDGGETTPLAAMRAWAATPVLAVAPDAGRVAYSCGGDVCLADPLGAAPARVGIDSPHGSGGEYLPNAAATRAAAFASLALIWSPDGSRLAIAAGTYPGGDRGPELWIADRGGRALHRLPIGPDGGAGEPAWTPDGRTILLTTFPRGGRRVVAIDAATGRVADLSRPRWDTFAALAPDGARVLLWNGRGGLWVAPLERPGRGQGRTAGGT